MPVSRQCRPPAKIGRRLAATWPNLGPLLVDRRTTIVSRGQATVAVPAAAALAVCASFGMAATDKRLNRVKGTVGFQGADEGQLHRVLGRQLLPDDAFAVTQANLAATLTLPDSSIVGIGTTSQLAVRGTVGILAFIKSETTVACPACAADSVTLTVGTQSFTIAGLRPHRSSRTLARQRTLITSNGNVCGWGWCGCE